MSILFYLYIMSKSVTIIVKESDKQLKELLKQQPEHLRTRIRLLMEIKQSKESLSKNELARRLGIDPNSANKWRKYYKEGGLKKLLIFKRGRKKPGRITPELHKLIEKKLSDPKDAFRSYEELRQWLDENYLPGIKYHAVNKYVKRKFKVKLKVARKSHINKDDKAVEAFKKTSRYTKE